MVTIEISKVHAMNFRDFLKATEGKDLGTLEDFFRFGKLRDKVVEVVEPIYAENKERFSALEAELKTLRDAAEGTEKGSDENKAVEAKIDAINTVENARLNSEMVSVELSDDMHAFVKENFIKIVVSKAKSAEVAYELGKALNIEA